MHYQQMNFLGEPVQRASSAVEREMLGVDGLPYDPTQIDIEKRTVSVYSIIARIRNAEVDLCPAFQRSPDLWNVGRQSRLIESLVLGIPLPPFYLTMERDEEKLRWVWHVVDGLQRLCAIRNFFIGVDGKRLKLKELEYLVNCNGFTVDDLPSLYRRNIEEAEVNLYLIRPGTPKEVKFNIFRRVNTGGKPLNQQEIRHAMNQGAASEWLARMAVDASFVGATGGVLKSTRMADREFVNRFLAFYLKDRISSYRNMDSYLDEALKYLGKCSSSEMEAISADFRASLDAIHAALGDMAFRRVDPRTTGIKKALNKALFEVLSVCVARLTPEGRDRFARRREVAQAEYRKLFEDPTESGLNAIVLTSTGHLKNIMLRYDIVTQYLKKVTGVWK